MARKKVMGTPVKVKHKKRKAIGEATNTLYTTFEKEGTEQARIGILNRMQKIEKQVAQEEGIDISDPGDQIYLRRALKKVPEYWRLKSQCEKLSI
jgi:hypothetical protein